MGAMAAVAVAAAVQAAQTASDAAANKTELNYQSAGQKYEQAYADAQATARQRRRLDQLRKVLGGQRSAFAASGVDPTQGSAAALAAGTAKAAALEQSEDNQLEELARGKRQLSLSLISRQSSLVPWQAGLSYASSMMQMAKASQGSGGGAEG